MVSSCSYDGVGLDDPKSMRSQPWCGCPHPASCWEGEREYRVTIGEKGSSAHGIQVRLAPGAYERRFNLASEFDDPDTTATPVTGNRLDGDRRVTVGPEASLRCRFGCLMGRKEWPNVWRANNRLEDLYGSRASVVDLRGPGRSRPS